MADVKDKIIYFPTLPNPPEVIIVVKNIPPVFNILTLQQIYDDVYLLKVLITIHRFNL
jgi:hypothetical protein